MHDAPADGRDGQLNERYRDCRLYVGVWVAADTVAAVMEYDRHMRNRQPIAMNLLDIRSRARTSAARIERKLRQIQQHLAAVEAALDADEELPPLVAQEPIAGWDVWWQDAVDLWQIGDQADRDRIMGWLATQRATLEATEAQLSLALEASQRSVRAAEGGILIMGDPTPPWIECWYDPESGHIIDVPECYTIGADRSDRPSPWIN